jgi:GT2 family glycosyltransferase
MMNEESKTPNSPVCHSSFRIHHSSFGRRLSVIIPSRERVDLLAHCLRAVVAHAPAGTEILVVDDASPDGCVSDLAATFPGVRVLRLGTPSGFCVAVNAGLRAATAPWVQLLNDDAEPTAGWAEPALAALAKPGVAAVAPLVLAGAPGTTPIRIDSAGDSYTLGGIARKRHHGVALADVSLTAEPVFGASGAAAFLRRDVVLSLGGLHEPLGAYFEDVDLAFRLHWAGWQVWFEPASRVWHRGGASHGPPRGQLLEQQSRNEELVFWRNMPAGLLWRALPRHLAVLAGKALRRLGEGTFWPFLRGRLRAWARILRGRESGVRSQESGVRGRVSEIARLLASGS